MVSIDPFGVQPPSLIEVRSQSDGGSGAMLGRDDTRRVRNYLRLVSLVSSLVQCVVALLLAWLLRALVDASWADDAAIAGVVAVTVIGIARIALTELRSRSYDVRLTVDAVIFEYGRTRSWVPRQHIQLLDIESSLMLRRFGLRRCKLHTAGGTVVISPLPATIATTIERLIGEQAMHSQPGPSHAVA